MKTEMIKLNRVKYAATQEQEKELVQKGYHSVKTAEKANAKEVKNQKAVYGEKAGAAGDKAGCEDGNAGCK